MDASTGALYCYHFDATGNTVAMTNASQVVVNQYAYTPFGEIAAKSETWAQPFTYVGQYGVFQESDNIYYMRARYYDASVGRFVSEDPKGFDGGDVNLYAYVRGNPVMFIDPLGLCPQIPLSPSGVSIAQNILVAQEHLNPLWFYNQVRNKGPWDYKQQGKQYADFGNFNYGATGSAFGFRDGFLRRMAGWAQQQSGNQDSTTAGSPIWGPAPYGDDPHDQEMIDLGIKYYENRCY